MVANTNELQVQIDDVYACPGSCGGCVLSAGERRAAAPDMAADVLDLAIERLLGYVDHLPQLSRLNLTYGIADHLMMDDAYLERIYQLGAAVVARAKPREPEHSAVFFTTALIGKHERLMPRLERLAGIVGEIPLLPVVVLDPALLYDRKFGGIYRRLILDTKALFGRVDLSINLSDRAVRQISADDIYAFAEENAFDELTVNWTPTFGNRELTTGDMPFLTQWLLDFDRTVEARGTVSSSFRPVLMASVNSVMCRVGDLSEATTARSVEEMIPQTIARSIQIDHLGNLLPKFEAIGDVPHSERFGYAPLGNLRDAPIAQLMAAGTPVVQRRIMAAHSRTRACASCEYSGFCAATGFHVFNTVLRGRNNGAKSCPHVARALFEHFYEAASAADPEVREAAE